MSHQLNRRAILAGTAAVVSAAAVASVPALADPGELSFPDLAARFDVLYARWRESVSCSRILPAGFIEPCVPTAASVPPSGPGWLHEIKHDDYRLML